ncbi:hypothetical protein NPIL_9721 [Nephila pilipes]|uniref:Uncharacterized protein n=1 Tax=Nephila pilipes TaxID=299642 RepID=A0A8X6JEH2_NEPPI|nr:hypothetical protein NPIL_132961 [Nephila pilipes]GFU14341.1 hypothetical protein NPIL_9721 [Nephila pilipes]
MCGLPEFSTRELRGWGSSEIQENLVDDEVLAESSFVALTDCQAPDLKGRLVPERKNVVWNPHKQSKRNIIPTVHSEVAYSFCQALNFTIKLAPVESRVVFDPQKCSRKHKITPIVHSEVIYKIFLALTLNAELVPLKESNSRVVN